MRRSWLGMVLCALCLSAQAGDAVPVTLRAVDGRPVTLALELALTPQARQQGLMERQALPSGHGMLFDFERDDHLVMWMKNTLIPLDMVFVAASGEVVDLIAKTTPLSETFLEARAPARYVIELNAGEAMSLGLLPGARLALPIKVSSTSPSVPRGLLKNH